MSEYVTHNATLQCSSGTAPSNLIVTHNALWSVQGNMIATTSDKIPMCNIMPFGTCKKKPTIFGFAPCVPALTVWTNFQHTVGLPGGNPLLDRSTLLCVNGGVIEVQHSGQMRPDKVGTHPNSPQIDALKRAALGAYPFCEECEKREWRKSPKITNIYWMDEKSDKPRALSELPEGKEATLCIETEEGGAGKSLGLIIDAPKGKRFKGGQPRLEYDSLPVEGDNTAYIENFKVEYDKKSSAKSDLKATGTMDGLETVRTLHTLPSELFQVFTRPCGAYDGEYGFDWMRLGKETIDKEDFRDTSEDFESLKGHYETIEIAPGVEYHVPWLCMFPDHKAVVGKDVELLFFTDPSKLPTVYEDDEVISIVPSSEGIIVTPGSITVNDLIIGAGALVKVECVSPLSSDGSIKLKLEDGGALVGKVNVVKNDHHKNFEVDVLVVENYIVDDHRYHRQKIDAELMKIERKDGTPVADKQEAYKRIEEYLNTQCLNQALIQVNFVFDKKDGVDKAFEWGFTKRTLSEVSKGINPKTIDEETRYIENYNYSLRYKDLLVDDATLRVNVQKYRDYINSQFKKGEFNRYAQKRCIILYLSGLSVMKITDYAMRVTHGVSSLWPTANQHCLVFNTGISSLPTIGHEIGHVLGLEHTFLPEREEKTGKVTKISQSDNIAKAEREKINRIGNIRNDMENYYKENSANFAPGLEKKYRAIVDAYEKDERQIIADMKCTAALNKYHFEKGMTGNIMDYDNNPRFFLHYQWKIMQEEIVKYYGKK